MNHDGLSRKFCSAENFGSGPIFSGKIIPPGTFSDSHNLVAHVQCASRCAYGDVLMCLLFLITSRINVRCVIKINSLPTMNSQHQQNLAALNVH